MLFYRSDYIQCTDNEFTDNQYTDNQHADNRCADDQCADDRFGSRSFIFPKAPPQKFRPPFLFLTTFSNLLEAFCQKKEHPFTSALKFSPNRESGKPQKE
jgi:hypothetical protein